MDVNRTREKLWKAVDELTAGTGTIQKRLAAASRHFCYLSLDRDVPEWLREDYSELDDQLNRIPDPEEGSIKATTLRMSDEEAKRCAREIVSMHEKLCRREGIEEGLKRVGSDAQPLGEIG